MTPCVVETRFEHRLPQSDHDTRTAPTFRLLRRPNRYQHTRQDTPAWFTLGMTIRDAVCAQGTAQHVVLEPVSHMLHGRFLS